MTEQKIIACLKQAYAIIDQFDSIVQKELIEKNNILPMTADHESLDTALGYLGAVIENVDKNNPENELYKKLIIDNTDTRHILSDAYDACELVADNLIENSDMLDAVTYLKSCLYTILNKTYTESQSIQENINNILEICEYGNETLDTIESVEDSQCDDLYLNKSGQRIHDRIAQLRHAFDILKPKTEKSDTNAEQTQNSENSD